nr:hypothetical protein [uncultured Allomuricauda sp.]
MKNHILLLMLLSFFSCDLDRKIELNGKWIIIEMTYDGKSVHPNTLNQPIRITYGEYESSESVTFKVSDSTITLPGFESEEIKTDFSYENEKIKITSNGSETELTNKIFSGTYDWGFSMKEKTLELKSKKTYIKMINQKQIINKAVDQVFDGL